MNKHIRTEMFQRWREANPHPTTELQFSTPFELLIAVLLSAQATDAGVNKATAKLFPVANTPQAMLDLGLEGIMQYTRTIGLYKTKSKHIIETCKILVQQYGGEIPHTREELEALPGVGRKTANVVLNTAFRQPVMAVDTHIFRVANRTKLAPGKKRPRSGRQTDEVHPERIPARRAPLADSARPLHLQSTKTAMQQMPDLRFMRIRRQSLKSSLHPKPQSAGCHANAEYH